MAADAWKLTVFQRAYALSLELHRASLGWPRVEQQYGGVADQLRRASKAVCALLVEGAIVTAVIQGKPDAADVARDAALKLVAEGADRA